MNTQERSKEFDFTVDGQPFGTSEHSLTPRQIMSLAGIDADTHYLTLVEGRHQVSYKGTTDDPIHMHEHMTFISTSTGPTPVS